MMTEKTVEVEVRAGIFETRTGIKGKKGDVISIPADEAKHTGSIRHGLRTGNLKPVLAETDLKPVTSVDAVPPQKAGEVRRLDDDHRETKGNKTQQSHNKQGGKKTSEEE